MFVPKVSSTYKYFGALCKISAAVLLLVNVTWVCLYEYQNHAASVSHGKPPPPPVLDCCSPAAFLGSSRRVYDVITTQSKTRNISKRTPNERIQIIKISFCQKRMCSCENILCFCILERSGPGWGHYRAVKGAEQQVEEKHPVCSSTFGTHLKSWTLGRDKGCHQDA